MNPWVRLCTRIYRRVARAYPHEFRMIGGDEMERLGEDAAPEMWRRYGFRGLVRLLADIAVRLPAEYAAELRQDARYAVRKLRQQPGFTAVCVTSLGLGIGMCVMFFGQIYGLALRDVPGLSDPDRLVAIEKPVSYPYFESYLERKEIASSGMAFIGQVPFSVAPEGTSESAERVTGHLVSTEYFSTAGITPSAGRFFRPEMETPGSPPVVVVSERFWRTRLHADPAAIGRVLRVNGRSAEIIGIGPEGFRGIFPMPAADVFVPLTVGPAVAPELRDNVLQNADRDTFRVVLRLAGGVTVQAAEAALTAMTQTLDQQKAEADQEPEGRSVALVQASKTMPMTKETRRLILSMNGFLLLMVLSLACANLASLLLARGQERRREVAIRLSVGASRFRLVRQMLTESVILSLAGGAAGLALYFAMIQASESFVAAEMDMTSGTAAPLDLGVVLFTLAASLAAAVWFGITPALASARTDVVTALKEGGVARLRGYRWFGMRNLFVVYQVAASLMFLLITGYVVVGYQRSTGVDPGFDTSNIVVVPLDPLRDGYSSEQSAELAAQLPERLERLVEVRSLTMTDRVTFGEMVANPNASVSVAGGEGEGQQAVHRVLRQRIGPNYFSTLGVPLLRGREFTSSEMRDSPALPSGQPAVMVSEAVRESAAGPRPVAASTSVVPLVISQAAASELFGGGDPIGGRVRMGEQDYAVVGVSQDIKTAALMAKPVPTIFVPLTVEMFGHASTGATFLVRGAPGMDTLGALRREMRSIDPALTIVNARTLNEHLAQFEQFMRWASVANGAFGLFGLILASIGLAAVTAHAVARRRKEIGIRTALGARRAQVLRLVLKEGVLLVVVGSLLGLLGATAIARAASSITENFAKIFAVGTGDPILVIGAPALLIVLALLACYLPARKAAQVDPLVALREE